MDKGVGVDVGKRQLDACDRGTRRRPPTRPASRCADLYCRLVATGKPPKHALVATMRKILTTRNAIARSRRTYSSSPPLHAA